MASVLPYLKLIAHFLRALFRSKHEQVILELALRQQRAVYDRTRPRPRPEPIDRAFLRESVPDESAPRYVIHDRDTIFSARVDAAIRAVDTEPIHAAYRCPWQNAYAERWIGTCRRELLDPVVVLDERHLKRLLTSYVGYYNADRVHTRTRDALSGRPVEPRLSSTAQVIALPGVGGLQHRYTWAEAA